MEPAEKKQRMEGNEAPAIEGAVGLEKSVMGHNKMEATNAECSLVDETAVDEASSTVEVVNDTPSTENKSGNGAKAEELADGGDATGSIEDEDEDVVYTIDDLIQQGEEATALLGGMSKSDCSYNLGALTRQPLYACLTCAKDSQPGAVCCACALHCHADHEIVEMYTKRNFTCDCGNSRFTSNCSLCPNKNPVNKGNVYNQTFSGLYCKCHRPYPDESPDCCDDEMIQCIVCEDWYHLNHLKFAPNEAPKAEADFCEMICDSCMSTDAKALVAYYDKLGAFVTPDENTAAESNSTCDSKVCIKPEINEKYKNCDAFATFWSFDWRSHLCKCEKCLNNYQLDDIPFISDWDDSLCEYERNARDADKAEEESMIAKMPRKKQQLMAEVVNSLQESLKSFCSKAVAADGSRELTITTKDALEIAEKMKQELAKKYKQNSSFFPPDTCR